MKLKTKKDVYDKFVLPEGKQLRLKDHDPAWIGEGEVEKRSQKKKGLALLSENVEQLAKVQERLYASDSYSVLLIFQAMDAAGKDGTIKHVMSGVNPQGCQVFSFKHPSAEELDHNFIWRYSKALPERGRIGIFNRSYYEDVLIVRVHPELLLAQKIPNAKPSKQFWKERFEDISEFERHLARNGTLILKFFLHVSKKEQKKRFIERLDDPNKHWKFSVGDIEERQHWKDYMHAYEEALSATSTRWAPWFVIPADNKWVSRALVAMIVTEAIERLQLQFPEVSKEKRKELARARALLESE